MPKKFLNLVLVMALMLTAFAFSVSAQDTERITFWSDQFQPERVVRQQAIIDAFEAENPGVEVELVVMDENLMDQLMVLNVAAGTPPDVVLHPLTLTAKWYDQGLLDAEFATRVIESLGEDTFAPGSLDLIRTDDGLYPAIPSDGWGQLLVYRADLFEEAGLEPPTTYEAIMTAAETLHDPDNDMIGFLGGSHPGEQYTWQVFEHIALANGVKMVEDGEVVFDSPEAVEAVEFYADLMSNYGPPQGADYYWLQTRADYFAGHGAMVVWSPFILDEMAGLRDSVLPNCEQCADDPAFIARNSGFVGTILGPSGEQPAAWGATNNIGLGPNASPAAQAFIEYYMNEAYLDALAVAPEGKFPMRLGTADEPTLYLDGWRELAVGVDRQAPLSDFYSEEVLNLIVEGAVGYNRMGYSEGNPLLASAVGSQFFIQEAVVDAINGDLTPEDAVVEIQIGIEDTLFDITE